MDFDRQNDNPFAAPQTSAEPMLEHRLAVEQPHLVVGQAAELPVRCLQTNAPTEEKYWVEEDLVWSPSFRLVLRRHTCRLRYYLAPELWKKRRRNQRISTLYRLTGWLAFVAAMFLMERMGRLLFVVVPFAIGLQILSGRRQRLAVVKFKNGRFWVSGCNDEFLSQLERELRESSSKDFLKDMN